MVLFALGAFASAGQTNAQSQRNQTKASPALQSPGAKQGLDFSVGGRGLDSLSFNGQSLLCSPQSGELQPWKSVFRAALDALLPHKSPPVITANKQTNSIELAYAWGRVSCAYGKEGDRLTMRIEVSNGGTEELDELSLRLMELNFPSVPDGGTLEAGMFGFGFKETLRPLYEYPAVADPQFVVPIVRVDYGTGALNFCSDDLKCSLSVPYSTNPPAKTSYPFIMNCHRIKPGSPETFNISLRFGPANSRVPDLSHDVLERYAEKYPFRINWTDRRPIGAIFLSSSGINAATNPRRWILNSGKIDITTDQGKGIFRKALLGMADKSIKVLKDAHAQGMITWDPEGQEFPGACYYGDPRLTPTLAPETEFRDEGTASAIDDYFAKFRVAGLDSTTTLGRPLSPDVFKAVAEAYPDVLLIPENESMRYFAYTAPFNSYVHHKVTSTPAGARMVYPKAFSVLMAPDGDRSEDHNALLNAVRSGDILLFNCWYDNAGAVKINRLYGEASRRAAAGGR